MLINNKAAIKHVASGDNATCFIFCYLFPSSWLDASFSSSFGGARMLSAFSKRVSYT